MGTGLWEREGERERERESGGIGATFEQGNDFFYLVRCLGSWVFRRKIFLFALEVAPHMSLAGV